MTCGGKGGTSGLRVVATARAAETAESVGAGWTTAATGCRQGVRLHHSPPLCRPRRLQGRSHPRDHHRREAEREAAGTYARRLEHEAAGTRGGSFDARRLVF